VETSSEDALGKVESTAVVLYYIIAKQCGDAIIAPRFDKTELLQYLKAE